MLSHFISTYKRLLQHTDDKRHRYLFDDFRFDERMIGVIGARGAGKTTLLLQLIKEKLPIDASIYVSLDHIYFTQHDLVTLTQTLYDNEGIRYFFFDEAHKYPNWNQELKNVYDAYPDIHIVFSGSARLDLVKGSYDLSRRGVMYTLAGMSFREYLQFHDVLDMPAITFTDLLEHQAEIEAEIASTPKLLGHFKHYRGAGYYPFVLEGTDSYHQKIQRTVEKTIYEDIVNHYNLKTENLLYLRKLLAYLATLPPSKLNVNNIAKHIGLDNKTVQHYLTILAETNLVTLLKSAKSGSQLLKKTEKIYLDNADLYQSMSEAIGFPCEIGTQREIFCISMLNNVGIATQYSKIGDIEANGLTFEIGGKHKTTKQIREKIDSAYLIKDDTLYGSRRVIPMYLLGFLY